MSIYINESYVCSTRLYPNDNDTLCSTVHLSISGALHEFEQLKRSNTGSTVNVQMLTISVLRISGYRIECVRQYCTGLSTDVKELIKEYIELYEHLYRHKPNSIVVLDSRDNSTVEFFYSDIRRYLDG